MPRANIPAGKAIKCGTPVKTKSKSKKAAKPVLDSAQLQAIVDKVGTDIKTLIANARTAGAEINFNYYGDGDFYVSAESGDRNGHGNINVNRNFKA